MDTPNDLPPSTEDSWVKNSLNLFGAIDKTLARVPLMVVLSRLASHSRMPDMLFHYTDVTGLDGILKTGKIWATHAAYLNDPREISYGRDEFVSVVMSSKSIASGSQLDYLERCLAEFQSERCLELTSAPFYACFSEAGDDLSQYRAYSRGGSGYCLGFSTKELLVGLPKQLGDKDKLAFSLNPIQYDSAELIEMFRRTLNYVWEWNGPMSIGTALADKKDIPIELKSRHAAQIAHMVCNHFKQDGFRSEREWRIMPGTGDWELSNMLGAYMNTRVNNGLFVPYLELPLVDAEERLRSLREIWVGPKLQFETTKLGLQKRLEIQNANANSIKISAEIKRSATYLQ